MIDCIFPLAISCTYALPQGKIQLTNFTDLKFPASLRQHWPACMWLYLWANALASESLIRNVFRECALSNGACHSVSSRLSEVPAALQEADATLQCLPW